MGSTVSCRVSTATMKYEKSFLLPASGEEFSPTPASIPRPGPSSILVHNKAIALNLVDWKIQNVELRYFPHSDWVRYRQDIIEAVAKVGEGVHCSRNADTRAGLFASLGKWQYQRRYYTCFILFLFFLPVKLIMCIVGLTPSKSSLVDYV